MRTKGFLERGLYVGAYCKLWPDLREIPKHDISSNETSSSKMK